MSEFLRESDNNPLYDNKFSLTIRRFRDLRYDCRNVTMPGISSDQLQLANQTNKIKVASNKLDYEDFQADFLVDENLTNYLQVFDWIRGITAPEKTTQFANLNSESALSPGGKKYNIFSDGTLIIRTNTGNSNIKVEFKDLFPISLSGLEFSYINGQAEVLMASVTFTYNYYDISTIST